MLPRPFEQAATSKLITKAETAILTWLSYLQALPYAASATQPPKRLLGSSMSSLSLNGNVVQCTLVKLPEYAEDELVGAELGRTARAWTDSRTLHSFELQL